MRPANNPLWTTAVSPIANQFSNPQWISFGVRASAQVTATSNTATGYVQFQASNDLATGLPAAQFTPTNWFPVGLPVSLDAIGNAILPEVELSYEYLRLAYFTLATGIQTIALVADSGGSLNNKYFLLSDVSTTNKYYVWFNINGAGVDPAIPGRTGVPIVGATNASAATLGAAVVTAVNALNSSNSFQASGTSTVTIQLKQAGPFTAMTDGTAATGFTFAVTNPTGTIQGRIKLANL